MTHRVFDLFFHPGEVTEIRVLGIGGKNAAWAGWCKSSTGAGYFDDAEALESAAKKLDSAEPLGVYFTVNPINPDLIARASRRIKADPKSTANDQDVVCLRWLLIDLDPKRPAGISSNDDELQAAQDLAKEIVQFLEGEMGFARAIRAMSGNGYHMCYRIPDLPNSAENVDLLRECLLALGAKFFNDRVDVDEKVFNPARIWKMYGTTGRKGDNTPSRQHRRSYVFNDVPETLADIPVTSIDLLKKLAAMAPKADKPPETGAGQGVGKGKKSSTPGSKGAKKTGKARKFDQSKESDLGPLDVAMYLSHYGREVIGTKTTRNGGTQYLLAECIFDPSHKREASIVANDRPPYLTYQCFHNSCKGHTWKDARAAISGNDGLAPFCAGYDPNWQPPGTKDPGPLATPPPPLVIPPPETIPMEADPADPPLPPPAEIDPDMFFKSGKRGPVFVPAYMANYFARYFGPIVHTDGIFWRYAGGVWVRMPKTKIFSAGTLALNEKAQPQWVENAIKNLAGTVNQEEAEWPDSSKMINCANGMIDIDRLAQDDLDNALLPHQASYGSRCQVPCTFNKDADCDRFVKFLFEIFPDDLKNGCCKQELIRQFFGYCLLNDCRFQKAMFLLGTGANGKSTLLNVLEAAVGRQNTSSLSLSALSIRFQTQFLQDKMVNLASETNTRDPLSTEIFKAVVAGDPVASERKYGDPFTFRPYAKWLIAMNDIPVIPDKAYGLTRRLLIIDFKRRFSEEEQDESLTEKLLDELDGIFLWMLHGLALLLRNKRFVLDGVVKEESKQFFAQLNPMLIWAEEKLTFDSDRAVLTKAVYEGYKTWCEECGYRKMGRNNFFNQILMHFPNVRKAPFGQGRRSHFIGMGMLLDDD
ncbi:MAG: hypothetical protein HGJ94_17200 [Desulfosarcina sp.]|nr:hypothetical protein [Desulfosarcina sp.]MBC2742122.1 hypothetical protein [Desulfosarcina sp.]MBC2765035.1 hypothetical protein [Desulfosarcina sp.]